MARIVYWIAVMAISLALVVALILFFESRDQSKVGVVPLAPGMVTLSHSR